jgi:DNA-binding CsgD family transcriptional regulator/tetratricopeptide (TPR) repeat protein
MPRVQIQVAASDAAPAVTSITSRRRMQVGDTGVGEAVGGRVSSPQFVGRTEQLEVLKAAFDQVTKGRTTTVLIGGDAGVGKTRLVEEFSTQVRNADALVATGVCVPTDSGGLPYAPIVGIVRDVIRQLDEPNADVIGPVARGLGIDTSGEALPADEFAKTRLFESILTFVTKTAHESPVVFVVEDLHWADSASAELLGYLVRNLTDTKALIVVTYRAEEVLRDHPLHSWLTELTRHPRTTPLRLSGLDRAETATLIGAILGEQPNWALADGVWARSQGNPFFAEELIAARDDPSLSPELQGVILSRVEALAKPTQQVLRIIATAGTTVTDRLVAALDVLDPAALDLALAEAVDRQILVVDASVAGYRFRHALLREAVYAAMLPGEARRLHRALATALTSDPSLGAAGPAHRVAELAGHWWAAGEWPQAFDASLAAADAAETMWAFPEALAHFEHALSALDRLPAGANGVDRVQLLAKVSEVAYLAGAGKRAVELAQAAVDSSDEADDPFGAARHYTLLGRHQWAVGESQAAFDAYRQATSLLPKDPPSVELARILAEEARWLSLTARNGDAEARCRQAIAVARAVGARAVEGHAMNTLGVCRAGLGHRDEGIELLRGALTIALEIGAAEDLDRAYTNLGHVYSEWGEHEEAAAMLLESRAAGEQRGFLRLNGVAENCVWSLLRLGRYDEAEAVLAEAGPRAIGPSLGAQLAPAQIAIHRGRFDDAAQLLAQFERSTIHLTNVQTRGQLHIEAAELALERDLPDDAYAEIERALAIATVTDETLRRAQMCALAVRALADQLAAARAHGKRVDADAARKRAADLIAEGNQPVEVGARWRPPQAAWIATCIAEQSRLSQSDAALWAEAVSLCDASHEVYPATYCRWRQAEALLESRIGRREAADCLLVAWQTASRIGAIPLRMRIEQLAQRARITLRTDVSVDLASPSSPGSDLGLTPREVEILGQLADGLTDREIAEALFISKKTASVHVSNVLHKLGVSNRVEAGRVGQAHGLGSGRATPAPAAVR